jgi:phosphatidylglycerol:prolipoprotein diacylglycerol transferase
MHPTLFSIGSFEMGTYGVLMASGFLLALLAARKLASKDAIPVDSITDLALTLLIAGIIGAKALMVAVELINGAPFSDVLSLSTLRSAGAVHGGILLGIAAFFWRTRSLGLPYFKAADIVTIALPLGQAIGRLGCLAAGCCFGTSCEMPWAMTITNPDAARFGVPLGIPLHPVQLYFSLASFAIFAGLFFYRHFRKFPGQIAAMYFLLEGTARIVLETWRDDAVRGLWFNIAWLSTGRITALALILVGTAIWLWSARAAKKAAA